MNFSPRVIHSRGWKIDREKVSWVGNFCGGFFGMEYTGQDQERRKQGAAGNFLPGFLPLSNFLLLFSKRKVIDGKIKKHWVRSVSTTIEI